MPLSKHDLMHRRTVLTLCLSGWLIGLPATAVAQIHMEFARTPASSGVSAFQPSPDVSLLREVNGWNHPAFRVGMQAADRTAYAGMFGSVPAWWVASALSENVDATDALHYSLAWAGTAGVVWAGKRLLARPRPYTVIDGLVDRGGRGRLDDRSSMPSGHASLSGVAATWLILEHPQGVAPWAAGTWAVAVGVSRVWKGVHYPSDVLVGMALGIGTGFLMHELQ